jgi:hypothetical protein
MVLRYDPRVALAWKSLDLIDDTDDQRFVGDPADLIDALGDFLELTQRPAWHRQAACRGKGNRLFFPDRGDSLLPAKELCSNCPVLDSCAEAGRSETTGIWGGLSGRQRRQERSSTKVEIEAA